MKLHIASDLHLEFLRQDHPGFPIIDRETDADVLVLAGDIDLRNYAEGTFGNWPVPVVAVAGNHEFYGSEYHEVRREMRQRESRAWSYLECETVEHVGRDADHVRFLGCTLWTDYALYGAAPAAMDVARRMMRDHSVIQWQGRRFTPDDALELHKESVAWLEAQLAQPFSGKTVVVTHHGPHVESVHPKYGAMALNAAFSSDLTHLLSGEKVSLWIHGHTHSSRDYVVNGARVVCNPCGYPSSARTSVENMRFENAEFNRGLVVEI